MEAEWLTFDEACEYLRQSRQTMYRLIGSGTVKSYQIPGITGRLFRKKELEELPTAVPLATTAKVGGKKSKPASTPKSKRT